MCALSSGHVPAPTANNHCQLLVLNINILTILIALGVSRLPGEGKTLVHSLRPSSRRMRGGDTAK